MISLRFSPQATVLYRGNLQDTASLVGLVLSRTPVGLIAFTGELNESLKKYFEVVDTWLQKNDLPAISIHPKFSEEQLKFIVDRPYREWNWSNNECEMAIRFAGLPMPPVQFVA